MQTQPPPKRGGTRPGAGRPPVNPSGTNVRTVVYLDPATLAAVDAKAERDNLSRSEIIRQALVALR